MEIQIDQYKSIENAGALIGSFTLIEMPEGRLTRNCQHFRSGKETWWKFPNIKIEKKDGSKPTYLPFIGFLDKGYEMKLKEKVQDALKEFTEKVSHGKADAHQEQTDSLQDQSSALWF